LALVKVIGAYAAPVSSICGYATISFWRLYDVNKRHCRVAMPLRKVFILITMLGISLVGYYLFGKVLQAVCLLIVVIFAVFINRSFLSDIVGVIKKRFIK